MALEPYQQRVVDEKKELDEKLEKLRVFRGGKTFRGLDSTERERMNRQEAAMTKYSTAWWARWARSRRSW